MSECQNLNSGALCEYCNIYYPNKRALTIHEYIHNRQDLYTLKSLIGTANKCSLPLARKNNQRGACPLKFNWALNYSSKIYYSKNSFSRYAPYPKEKTAIQKHSRLTPDFNKLKCSSDSDSSYSEQSLEEAYSSYPGAHHSQDTIIKANLEVSENNQPCSAEYTEPKSCSSDSAYDSSQETEDLDQSEPNFEEPARYSEITSKKDSEMTLPCQFPNKSVVDDSHYDKKRESNFAWHEAFNDSRQQNYNWNAYNNQHIQENSTPKNINCNAQDQKLIAKTHAVQKCF